MKKRANVVAEEVNHWEFASQIHYKWEMTIAKKETTSNKNI